MNKIKELVKNGQCEMCGKPATKKCLFDCIQMLCGKLLCDNCEPVHDKLHENWLNRNKKKPDDDLDRTIVKIRLMAIEFIDGLDWRFNKTGFSKELRKFLLELKNKQKTD